MAWNRRISLTALPLESDPNQAIDRLIVEPLLAARYIQADRSRLTDVGSGTGSPAIPLKLAIPGLDLLMVEPKARKAAFLNEVIRALELPQARTAMLRLDENAAATSLKGTADLVTLRAVRLETSLIRALELMLAPAGRIFLFRSVRQPAPGLPPTVQTEAIHRLDSSSTLLILAATRSGDVPRGT